MRIIMPSYNKVVAFAFLIALRCHNVAYAQHSPDTVELNKQEYEYMEFDALFDAIGLSLWRDVASRIMVGKEAANEKALKNPLIGHRVASIVAVSGYENDAKLQQQLQQKYEIVRWQVWTLKPGEVTPIRPVVLLTIDKVPSFRDAWKAKCASDNYCVFGIFGTIVTAEDETGYIHDALSVEAYFFMEEQNVYWLTAKSAATYAIGNFLEKLKERIVIGK
jgi:hypothetical protein